MLQSQFEEVLIATGSRLHVAASKEEKSLQARKKMMDPSIRNKEDDNKMIMRVRKSRNNGGGREPPPIEADDCDNNIDYNDDQKKEENEVTIRDKHKEINLKYDSDRCEEENFDNAIDAFIKDIAEVRYTFISYHQITLGQFSNESACLFQYLIFLFTSCLKILLLSSLKGSNR